MKVIILAGGFATRLESRTNNGEIAKTLLPITVEGKTQPILHFILDKIHAVKSNEITEVIVVSNNKYYEQIRSACKEWKTANNSNLQFALLNTNCNDKSEAKGANADLNLANRYIPENSKEQVLVMASDNYFNFPLDNLINYYNYLNDIEKASSVVVSKKYPESEKEFISKNYGILNIGYLNRIISLDEKPGLEKCKSTNVSLALYVMDRNTFSLLDTYLEENANNPKQRDSLGCFINYIIHNSQSYTYPHSGIFYDIGSPEEYDKLSGKTNNL